MSNWTYKWPEGSPKVGDTVQHTSQFLRNTGWYTNVPKDGKVLSALQYDDPSLLEGCVRVQWCDSDVPLTIRKDNIKPSGAWEPN